MNLTQLFLEHGPVAVVAALATLVLTKAVEYWFARRARTEQNEVDEARLIRTELRTEVVQLKSDIREMFSEVDEWRDRYLDLRDDLATVTIDRDRKEMWLEASRERTREMHATATLLARELERVGGVVDISMERRLLETSEAIEDEEG